MTNDQEPRVWIGCLACYNAGCLIGHWFDADGAADVTVADVHAGHFTTPDVMNELRNQSHDELNVFDFDGFRGYDLGECSPALAQSVAEKLDEAELAGADVDAFVAWVQHTSTEMVDADVELFTDAFRGHWGDEEDFAQDLANEMGVVPADLTWPTSYIDWARAARDLFLDGYTAVNAPGGGVWVFSDYAS